MSARMVNFAGIILAVLGGVAVPGVSGAVPLAGHETSATLPSGLEAKLFVPPVGDGAGPLPVIFFFHGMGGSPDTAWLRAQGGDAFVVLGMPYLGPVTVAGGKEESHADYMTREQQHFRQTLAWLRERVAVNPRRIYLAGVSKGGWHAAELGEREAGNLAGLAILLAGRHPTSQAGTVPRALKGMPIYLGSGESDANFVDATRARLAYGAVGAYVTFEVYEGLGHQTPVRASRLADWLVVQARLGGREAPAAVQSTFKQACQDAYRTADAVTDQAARYRALRAVAEDPRLPWCGEAVYRGVWTKLAEAARSPAVQTEWGAEQEFMKIVQVESTARRLEDMAQVAKRLAALRTEAGLTLYGRIAGSFLEPYQDAYARALAATAAARQNAPGTPATLRPKATGGPSVGGSQVRQVREGNRVIFERD